MAKTAERGVVVVEGNEVTVTRPDKLLWPESGIRKLDYLQHLVKLAPYLLPYCRNRYLTTIRYPDGIDGKSFYQKNAPAPVPAFVRTARLNGIDYVHLDSLATLLWLGNLGALEFHPSFQYIGGDIPAEWVLDIDPSREREPRLMQAVLLIGEVLDKLRIEAVPKTSGATGVQLYIPIRDGYTFAELRKIGHFIGSYMCEKYPDLFTIERLKKNRGDRIYIDYIQHWSGKSIAAPYTPRARKGAPVSTPLLWEEVEAGADPRDFHLLNIDRRLREKGDLIARVRPQSLDHVLSFISG